MLITWPIRILCPTQLTSRYEATHAVLMPNVPSTGAVCNVVRTLGQMVEEVWPQQPGFGIGRQHGCRARPCIQSDLDGVLQLCVVLSTLGGGGSARPRLPLPVDSALLSVGVREQ